MKRLTIDLAELPEDGKTVEDELDVEVFDLPEGDAVPLSPLQFRLRIQRFESELLLEGSLSATFEFTCVRTLHPFVQTIRVDHAAISIEIGHQAVLDVTDAVREELLIAFPANPICEEGDQPGHCEINPRYLSVDKPSEDELTTPPRVAGDARWGALDDLKDLQDPSP